MKTHRRSGELRVHALGSAFSSILKHWILFGILFILILIALLCYHMVASSNDASLSMSFNYEQASSGLNPNGTRFNISEFKDEEVLQKAIEYAGLQDVITPDELSDAISVKNGGENRAGVSNFINTTYTITLGKIDLGKRVSRMDMLKFVCRAYKEHFMDLYADNQAILDFSLQSLESQEYLTQVQILEMYANQLNRYVSSRLSENSSFKNETLGESFGSLHKKLQYFIDYELVEIKNYILDYGISVDSSDMLSRMEYSNLMLQKDYDKAMAHYDMDNLGISMYETMMGSVIMIPTRDSSNQYYMSRTKTEMDYLSADANYYLGMATEYQKQINYNNYVMDLIQASNDDGSRQQKVQESLTYMKAYLTEVASQVKKLDTSYILYKTKSYINVIEINKSLKDRADVKTSLVEAFVICLLIFAIQYMNAYRKLQKSSKERFVK